MTMAADVLIAGSGTMAYLLAMFFANTGRRVSMSSYRPCEEALKEGIGLDSAIEGRSPMLVPAQDILLDPSHDPVQPGQIGVFVRSRSGPSHDLEDLRLESNKLVVFATKTFSNAQVVQDLQPVLRNNADLTFFTTQNGVHPETEIKDLLESSAMADVRLCRGIAQGGAFPIRPGVLKNTITCYSLGYWGKQEADAEFSEQLKALQHHFSDDTIPAEICFGEHYKVKSLHKAIANTLNSTCFLFSARVGEILDNERLRKFTKDKNYESIMIAKEDMGLDLNVEGTKNNCFLIYEALRPHYPSMAVDAFRSFVNPSRKLDTEIDHLDWQFIRDSRGEALLNKLCAEMVEDFVQAFNEIRGRSYRRAVIFGLRFMVRNRLVAGLPPYKFFEIPILRMNGGQEWIKSFEEHPTVPEGTDYLDIFSKVAAYYGELKEEYAEYLSKPFFEYTVSGT